MLHLVEFVVLTSVSLPNNKCVKLVHQVGFTSGWVVLRPDSAKLMFGTENLSKLGSASAHIWMNFYVRSAQFTILAM